MFAGGLKRVDAASASLTGLRNFAMADSPICHQRPASGTAQRVFLENAARDAEQEKLDEARHNGLASLALDHVDDLVVRRGVELHQNLAHDADARLGALALQRQRIEVFHDLVSTVRLNSERFTPRASCALHSAIQWSNRWLAAPGSIS